MEVLDIKSPKDIKNMDINELNELSEKIRDFLVDSISKTGGHLSSNLGVVELTLALHYVFDSTYDKFIFDVGHQSYTHKIVTGRAKEFANLRKYKGLSGFQKRRESTSDPWEAGHSSTSLSAALGFAVARDLNHENYHVIPIIGDAALASGMSFEALNQIGSEKRNMIIILNDNEMSISRNVGAMSHALTDLRSSKSYTNLKRELAKNLEKSPFGENILGGLKNFKDTIKDKVVDSYFFDEMGIDYIGPVNGHDIREMIKVFSALENHDGPIVIHIKTTKGKGYCYAENDTTGKYHGIGKFNKETGQELSSMPLNYLGWSAIMSETLIRLAKDNKDIIALTPAMKNGSKLEKFEKKYPDRFFDCGIAEEHTMTYAAALAAAGKQPVVSIYSSFMQRAYDSINHDVARMKLSVVIIADRSGLVGEDGPTHHGVFDIAMCRSIPNLIMAQPKDGYEAQDLLYTALQIKKPFLIRIPRGNSEYKAKTFESIEVGTWTLYEYSNNVDALIITYGDEVDKVIQKIKVNEINLGVVNARFFKPIDTEMLDRIVAMNKPLFIYETDVKIGGLSSAILEYLNDTNQKADITRIGICDHYVEQGSIPQIRHQEGIDINTLFDQIMERLNGGHKA